MRRRAYLAAALLALLFANPSLAQDADGDGVADAFDNCLNVDNGPLELGQAGKVQCDTDRDGYGNICDPDFDQNGSVNGNDFNPVFVSDFQTQQDSGAGTDMNCNGVVNAVDFSLFSALFSTATVGPSGLSCASDAPCPRVSIDSPSDGTEFPAATTSISISGTVEPPDAPVSVNGFAASVSGSSFTLSSFPLGPATTKLTARVDIPGQDATDSIFVSRQPPPALPPAPEPSCGALPVDLTVATDFAVSAACLYTGPSPTQTVPDPNFFVPERVAILRGQVLDRDGGPVPGVKVMVLGTANAGVGFTTTRTNGWFDLAVNGGGQLVVDFTHPAFLRAQRRVTVPVNDFAYVGELILTELDSQTSTIAIGAGTLQAARGSVVSDADGERQATVLFPPGTTATMTLPTLPNPTTVALTSPMIVRATEYTTGDVGIAGMPAELPTSSGYTYAVELTVDQALDAGATRVNFSQPVPVYLENFVGFPVGMDVPVAFYDHGAGRWVPVDDGRVIKIISITSGAVNIDSDGNGTADTLLGLSTPERQQLASLYAVGDELWRVTVTRFSPYDCNWPYGPPSGAVPPDLPIGAAPRSPDPDCAEGSIIECQNQVLREEIELVGVPSRLHYSSARVPGRAAESSFELPLTGPTLPPGLKRVDVDIQIAGQRFRQQLAPVPNLLPSPPIVWNGLDAYGRPVQGSQTAQIQIDYVYDAVYQAPAPSAQSFGVSSGVAIATDRQRAEFILGRSFTQELRVWNAFGQGLGGWSMSEHHVYDPGARVLYLGDGSQRSVDAFVPRLYAGNGVFQSVNNAVALAASFFDAHITGLAVGPDGSLFVADGYAIRKIAPSGGAVTNTGLGNNGLNDGLFHNESYYGGLTAGPDGSIYAVVTVGFLSPCCIDMIRPNGTIAHLNGTTRGMQGVAFGPDGALFVSRVQTVGVFLGDSVYRVFEPSGTQVRVAGGGALTPGEGAPAVNVLLQDPTPPPSPGSTDSHFPIAVDASGAIFVGAKGRIQRIGPDGIIRTIAGNGNELSSGDGGPASQALVRPISLALGPDGTLFFGEIGRIRAIRPNGTVVTVLDLSTTNGVSAITVSPDGTLYYSVLNQIFVVENVFPPDATGGLFRIASEDGREVYVFDASGRHLRTEHGLTGVVLREFAYDGAGRLVTITDADDNVTTIERDGSGAPTGIEGPFGALTDLSTDSAGYLDAITNPAGESWQPQHASTGLLDFLATPRNHTYAFFYDVLGRLIRDRDPEVGAVNPSGGIVLSRNQVGSEVTVTKTSPEGVVEGKTFEILDQGAEIRTNTRPNPDGPGPLETLIEIGADHTSRAISEPDGTEIDITAGLDPRFGLQAPFIESLTIDVPGHSFVRTAQRTADVHPVTGALLGLTDTISVNGKPPTMVDFDAAASTILTTSPEGREVERTIDALGRTTGVAIGPPPGSGGFHPIELGYDAAGRLDFISQGTGADQRLTDFQYDVDGNLQFVVDPLHTTQLGYDDANRVELLTRPDLQAVGFGYDANGNLDAVTPPSRPTHGFNFTKVDQESLYTPPAVAGTGPTTTLRDLDRRLDDILRPDGTTLDFEYDGAGRLDTITVPGRGIVDRSYSTTTGHLTSILTPEGSNLALGYDGFLPETQTWSGPVAGSVSRNHNNELLVASETVMGNTVSFLYDDDNLLMSAGAMTLVPDSNHGLLRTTALGSVTTSQDYSAFAELSNFEAMHGATQLYREEILLRDKLGRIVDRHETIGGVATDYQYVYDAAGRLEQVFVNSVLQTTYAYHPNGARTSKTSGSVTSGSYDAQDRIETWGALAFTHTANGERLARTDTSTSQTTTYTYDALGNLTRAVLPGGTIDYVVDGLNRRIGKKVAGSPVKAWLYRDQLEPVAELDGSGALVSRFVYASKPHVPDYMVKGGQTYRIVSDHLGSVRLVVNASTGVVAQRIDYDEFGNPTFVIGPPDFQPFGFAGGLYDPDTKLVRFGARDYDPETGRWTAKDPIGFDVGDPNLYAYASSDPVNKSDPWGLKWRYSQSTHRVTHVDDATGAVTEYGTDNYSGNGEGLNNPQMESVPNVGPIPQGNYAIGPQRDSPNTGAGVLDLTPAAGTNTFGRSDFQVHGDNAAGNQSASQGCVVAPRSVRDAIAGSGDSQLEVVP